MKKVVLWLSFIVLSLFSLTPLFPHEPLIKLPESQTSTLLTQDTLQGLAHSIAQSVVPHLHPETNSNQHEVSKQLIVQSLIPGPNFPDTVSHTRSLYQHACENDPELKLQFDRLYYTHFLECIRSDASMRQEQRSSTAQTAHKMYHDQHLSTALTNFIIDLFAITYSKTKQHHKQAEVINLLDRFHESMIQIIDQTKSAHGTPVVTRSQLEAFEAALSLSMVPASIPLFSRKNFQYLVSTAATFGIGGILYSVYRLISSGQKKVNKLEPGELAKQLDNKVLTKENVDLVVSAYVEAAIEAEEKRLDSILNQLEKHKILIPGTPEYEEKKAKIVTNYLLKSPLAKLIEEVLKDDQKLEIARALGGGLAGHTGNDETRHAHSTTPEAPIMPWWRIDRQATSYTGGLLGDFITAVKNPGGPGYQVDPNGQEDEPVNDT